ncbi:hypothetical protein [Natrarchaeobius chitinivorans]|uniref:Beta-ketoacyl-[acyl-carrier-protein] synthase III N-terminal domain-containing protein n=1 Tax=Natrarchaeobius chitinivorans TaxID=1679083 RepID=A0A3N6NA21_NATCH|nr:hypothetical protein [Natrarchaeobius chitinivorans]RQG95422.1 hypothetical protein EA473_08130 [Natrarchaeobius chitinivorans]
MTASLLGGGAYTPRYRIDAETISNATGSFAGRGIETKAVASADEDAVTMGVEAAERALADAGCSADDVGSISVGTTTPPVDEGDVGVQFAEMLGLRGTVDVSIHTQSTRGGTRALLSAVRAPDSPGLVIATDCPKGPRGTAIDDAAGAGAVAFVVGSDGPVTLEETGTYAREFSGTRFRRRGSTVTESYGATAYERRAYTEVSGAAIEAMETTPGAIAPTAPNGSLPYRAAGSTDADPAVYELAACLGDTGTASPFFGLLDAWAGGETDVLVVGYGDGSGADAIALQGSLSISWERETTDIRYAEYAAKRARPVGNGGDP